MLVFLTAGPGVGLPCFIALFVIGILGSIAYHAANISSDNGINTEVFDFEVEGYPTSNTGSSSNEPDFAERLRDLERLREDELISEEEYQAKRTQIMTDKW